MRTPVSTYRLQIRPGFTLQDAAELTEYLRNLGIDWVYVSPILTAEEGSDHGYDVTDPSSVDPARGGAEGLVALSKAARQRGLGILADIVPNHMGVASPGQNAWWWQLLKEGRSSKYAEAFDVDWEFGGGKIRIPVLGSDDDLEQLKVVDDELHYYDHRFPLAEGTFADGDSPQDIHARQHYELVGWRRADAELNYRRFFAVNTLAGVRVEVPWVFDESHQEILRWFREELVDGLRIDHPDGLADPEGYLKRLREATGGAYLLVEKILEPGEKLPETFSCEGTTGYDALADIDRLFVDPAAEEFLDSLDARLRDEAQPADYHVMIHGTKRRIADGILRSEILRLSRLVPETSALPRNDVADALAEIICWFPVYRTYLPHGREILEEAIRNAGKHRPELAGVLEGLRPLLLDTTGELARRFQQTSGMVMAKGVEDTAFFRYTRLGTLTEVGADPTEFALSPEVFHERMASRQAELPLSMTTLSTHDTKRSEDARARISVISESVPEWELFLGTVQDNAHIPDGPLAALVWQAIAGAWPADRSRLQAYALKAAREAGNSTNWTDPDLDFERHLAAAVDAVFDVPEVAAAVENFVDELEPYGRSNSLSAKLIHLTMPGVPDVYQGTEFRDGSLTDPDNRRPVDFAARIAALAELDKLTGQDKLTAPDKLTGEDKDALPAYTEDAAKLLVVSRALRLRRDRPELFGGYEPVPVSGDAAQHVVAFHRGADRPGAVTVATRLPKRLAREGGWKDTVIELPTTCRDELTGATFAAGSVAVANVLGQFPVALLVPVD